MVIWISKNKAEINNAVEIRNFVLFMLSKIQISFYPTLGRAKPNRATYLCSFLRAWRGPSDQRAAEWTDARPSTRC